MNWRLLAEFKALFDGKQYKHRKSNQGDWVAHHLYEDLVTLGRSSVLMQRVSSREHVLNVANRRTGVDARRGDGTFGELIPGIVAIIDPGFAVARGPIANVEIGVEVKILAKAMLKQINRVQTDLINQVQEFNKGAGSPICVAVVGINCAEYAIGYEGTRATRTGTKEGGRHPFQEAEVAEERIRKAVDTKFDELIILRYKATNEDPYTFEWASYSDTFERYGAALTRISREYDTRFG